jgi:hypothetical protein
MKFSRYDKLARISALKPVNAHAAAGMLREESFAQQLTGTNSDELCALLGGTVARNDFGEHLSVRRWYAEPEEFTPAHAALEMLSPECAAKVNNARSWLFLDTETTGLSGGTGTYAFLVGVAWWDAGGLQIEQFFMRDFGEEHSLLLALAERIAERPVLVTFNGKTFDWPLLETRFRMTRAIKAPALRGHLDLLHPARQLWRLGLPSLRLVEIEKSILGFDRGPDLWSAMIPQLYFDFLRGAAAAPLADVFRHNQMDLRGLAALARRMMTMLAEPEAADGDALELHGLSRLLRRRGDAKRARLLYEKALAAGLPAQLDRAARRELAALAKRDLDFERATELWNGLLECSGAKDPPQRALRHRAHGEDANSDAGTALEAYEQLAIYYEHRAREPQRAAGLTRDAIAALTVAHREGTVSHAVHRRLRERLTHRLARLERKANRLPL